MNKNDSLGNRMKQAYENTSRYYLPRRIPVAIRIDGKSFHSFTKGFARPFDAILMNSMQETMKYMCEHIQGCVFGYTQSDEITLILTDYEKVETDAWFGNNVQKMASVSASMATLAFNRIFKEQVKAYKEELGDEFDSGVYERKFDTAMFDARVFSIPVDEVCNCLIWRQDDAIRNSIESTGYANFSNKDLHGVKCSEIKKRLWEEKGISWDDFPADCRQGACCYKVEVQTPASFVGGEGTTVRRKKWQIDRNIPKFSADRYFVEQWL